MTTDFEAVAKLPTETVYVAAILSARRPETGAIETFYVTDAPALFTEPEDSPPNKNFRSVVVEGWTYSSRITERGRFVGKSESRIGSLVLDGDSPYLADWEDLDWNQQPASVRLGGARKADGSPFPWRSYEEKFAGVTTDVVPTDDGDLEFFFSTELDLGRFVVGDYFRGFGGAIEIPDSGSYLAGPSPPDLPGSTYTVEWVGELETLHSSGALRLYSAFGAYGLEISSSGFLSVRTGSGLSQSTYAPPVGVALYLAAVVYGDAAGTVDFFASEGTAPPAKVATLAGVPAPGTGASFLYVGGGATSAVALRAWDARIWKTARTTDEVSAGATGPVPGAETDADLFSYHKLNDAVGTTAIATVGGVDLSFYGTPAWGSSYDGDDAEDLDGALAGVSKSEVWGIAYNVGVVPLDSQFGAYGFSLGASRDLFRIRIGGAPLVPDESVIASGGGDMIFSSVDDSVALLAPLSGHRFVPRTVAPPRAGQIVSVANSSSNDGDYEVVRWGASARKLFLRAVGGGAANLANETAGAGVEIRTREDERSYTYDLATSRISTTIDPEADMTADVWGRVPFDLDDDRHRVSDLFEELLGKSVDTSALVFNPRVGFWIPPGQSIRIAEVFDALVASCVGWWKERRDGSVALGTFVLPSGNPAREIPASKIESLSPVRYVTPWSQISVGYAKTWKLQSADGLVDSVPANLRTRYSEPYRYVRRDMPTAEKARYPLAEPRDPFETYLLSRSDALRFLDLAAPLYLEQRRGFVATVSGVDLTDVEEMDEVRLFHPDAAHGLVEGQLTRVLAIEEDHSDDVVTIEVFY